MKFVCHFKGNSYTGDNDKTRKPLCKKYRGRCNGEVNCDYAKEQDKRI